MRWFMMTKNCHCDRRRLCRRRCCPQSFRCSHTASVPMEAHAADATNAAFVNVINAHRRAVCCNIQSKYVATSRVGMLQHPGTVCCNTHGQYVATPRVSMFQRPRPVCCNIQGQYATTPKVSMLKHPGTICRSIQGRYFAQSCD